MQNYLSTVAAAEDFAVVVVAVAGLLVMAMGHICVVVHVINDVSLQIRYHQPSKTNQNHPRISQNTCAMTDSCESHSI